MAPGGAEDRAPGWHPDPDRKAGARGRAWPGLVGTGPGLGLGGPGALKSGKGRVVRCGRQEGPGLLEQSGREGLMQGRGGGFLEGADPGGSRLQRDKRGDLSERRPQGSGWGWGWGGGGGGKTSKRGLEVLEGSGAIASPGPAWEMRVG
jgi:hypothetical protein